MIRKVFITLKAPIPITVNPSERALIPLVNVANNKIEEESNGPALSRPLTREETLTTLDYQPRMKAFADEEHPFRSKGFLSLQATLLLIISTTAVFLRRRVQLKEDPKRALAQSAQKASRKAYNQAMSATTVAEFYQAALSAVRHAATARTKEDQSNATFNQLHTLIKNPEKNPEAIDALKQLCSGADALHFSDSNKTTISKPCDLFSIQLLKRL